MILSNSLDPIILKGHHVSEKSSLNAVNQCYVFVVSLSASKLAIKYAVESFFKVDVERVNTLNQKAKNKSFKGKQYKSENLKKAYVFLKDGFSIDLN